ncbi:MAG: ABC transporter permease, partial [Planktothrix sp.]
MSLSGLSLIKLSCSSLLGSPVRSFLSGIGVFMGVAAVSATLQVGSISTAVIKQQLAERDAPQVFVFGGFNSITEQYVQLSLEDLKVLQQQLKGLKSISGTSRMDTSQVVFQNQQADPSVMAKTIDFLNTSGRKLIAGRSFTANDFEAYHPVIIIDKVLADKLFKQIHPTGKTIYLNFRPYIVIGIIESQESQQEEPKGEAYLPMAIYSAITGEKKFQSLQLRPYKIEELETLGEQTKKILETRFPGYKFYAWNTVRRILEQKKTLDSVSQALLVVGAISLIVGG